METKKATCAQEAIMKRIVEKQDENSIFQDHSDYSDYSDYFDYGDSINYSIM
jgi:hypothetical protein